MSAVETSLVRRRYDRIAPIYDLMEWVLELRFASWRRRLWHRVAGPRILEIGVGTGKNCRFYPAWAEVTAIDISPGMLRRAQKRIVGPTATARFEVADAQALPYDDASFDTVVGTFVFCSVPDPLQGLREARRVLVPGGRLYLLEHVLSQRILLRSAMKMLDPTMARMSGAHLARETVRYVHEAGFEDVWDTDLALDVVKWIGGLRA